MYQKESFICRVPRGWRLRSCLVNLRERYRCSAWISEIGLRAILRTWSMIGGRKPMRRRPTSSCWILGLISLLLCRAISVICRLPRSNLLEAWLHSQRPLQGSPISIPLPELQGKPSSIRVLLLCQITLLKGLSILDLA